ncbi:hypothetical protein ACOSP7_032898 [Xanthoceras sorbifolium]
MQQRKSSASGRPSGMDGSDFSCRTVVDSRYTMVAKSKSSLSPLIFTQVPSLHLWLSAIIQLIGVLHTYVLTSKEKGLNTLAISSAFARLFSMFASSVAIVLSVFSVVKCNSALEKNKSRSSIVVQILGSIELVEGRGLL